MASFSSLSSFVLLSILCVSRSSYARDFSIVGYSPDDLASAESVMGLFESWMSRHGKVYESIEEKWQRYEVFEDNLKHIDETNRNGDGNYWLGLNEFADLSHQEFKSRYLGLKPNLASRVVDVEEEEEEELSDGDLPSSVDWRKKGAVTPVKNQGQCGSCWAFSTVAAVEGISQIVTGKLTSLSEQELIDCDVSNSGCNGGLMDYAFRFIMGNRGIRTEDDYPYLMKDSACLDNQEGKLKMVTIDGYRDVPSNRERSLLKAIANQPVSVAIDASDRHFQFYKGGVFNGTCGTELDHGVAAVGYGSSKGLNYIVVKNSWGVGWGENGYIRMIRSTSHPEGKCGINKMASYPIKNVH